MQLLIVKIFALIVFVVDDIQTELSPDGKNVCLIKETYKDKIMIKNRVPKVTNKKKWCWNISKKFSCDYSVVNWIDVTEFRPINRTKIVPKCCDGYFEEGIQVKYCSPICLKGCGKGRCIAPETCRCYSGFYGSNCDKACPDGFWGKNCVNTCECFNNGKCNNLNGVCDCKQGWTGNKCEFPCQDGYYGYQCKMKCDCGNFSCNPKTGECFIPTALIATEAYSKLSESTEKLIKTEKTRDEYITDDVIGITENSTSKEFSKIISMTDLLTSFSINATKDIFFSHLPSESTEETEKNSAANLLTESFTEETQKNSAANLLTESFTEETQKNSVGTLLTKSFTEETEKNSAANLLTESFTEETQKNSVGTVLTKSFTEETEKNSAANLLTESFTEETQKNSVGTLLTKTFTEETEKNSAANLLTESFTEETEKNSAANLLTESFTEETQKNSVGTLLTKTFTEETEKNSAANLLTESFTEEMSISNEKEKLIYGEKSETDFQDSSETFEYSIKDYYSKTESENLDEATDPPLNNPINNMARVKFSGSKQAIDNFINEEKSSHRTTIFYFLPAFFAFSSASFLAFIIVAIWLINKYRDKTKKKLESTEKKYKILQLEEQIKCPTENFFWSNSCTNNPVCSSNIDLNRTAPVLETFKPLTSVDPQMKRKLLIVNHSLKTSL